MDIAQIERRIRLETLNITCAPREALSFARVMLRMGCSREVAFAAGEWHVVAPVMPDAIPDSVVCELDADVPTATEWRKLLGEDFDIEAGEALYDRAVHPELRPDSEAATGDEVSRQ